MPQSGFFMNLNEANAIRPMSLDLIRRFYRITMTDVFQQYSKSADQSIVYSVVTSEVEAGRGRGQGHEGFQRGFGGQTENE